ncbi:MAG: YidB family protein [Steroidobacteraceae bacterium]
MGLLDGVLGGVAGAAMVSVVSSVLEKHGGVQGIVKEFESKGLGETVKSWVSTGPNQPISPDQVHSVLGTDLLQQLAAKSGLSLDDLKQKLAHVLPQAVDKMTPGGVIPKSA